jgi:putative acyl-CoA dehydrogenase
MLLAFRLAAAFDASPANDSERELQRMLTPIAKYWLCKRMTPVATEAMECLGGNGYVEESPLARLYREAPLNGIWEGSANVICLDVLRALAKSPDALEVLSQEVGRDGVGARSIEEARGALRDPAIAETQARLIVERLALAMQSSLMKRHSDGAAADAFEASRITQQGGRTFGTLPAGTDAEALLKRAALEA